MRCCLSLILWLSLMCGSASANVFGEDDRAAAPAWDYPYRAVGVVNNIEGGLSTAVLIAPQIALSVAHGFVDERTGRRELQPKAVFRAGWRNGRALGETRVVDIILGTVTPAKERSQDWALLVLEERLGDQFGYFGVKNVDAAGAFEIAGRRGLNVAAISTDWRGGRTLWRQRNCRLRGLLESHQFLFHDCDITRGSSGAPLFVAPRKSGGWPAIIALNVSERRGDSFVSLRRSRYTLDYANIATPAASFFDAFWKLRRTLNQ